MMYIEDLMFHLYSTCTVSKFDSAMVDSFGNQILMGTGFTEKQSTIAVRILKRYKDQLNVLPRSAIDQYLENPTFKFPIRKLNYDKRISIINHAVYGKAIKVAFPYDQTKVETIRKNKNDLGIAAWDPEEKAWIFNLCESNILFLLNHVITADFEVDEEFTDYGTQLVAVLDDIESHAPMLILDGKNMKYRNVAKTVPEISSETILGGVFEARKSGIFTWDDSINAHLKTIDLHPVMEKFLSDENSGIFEIDSSSEPVQCLADIVQYMSPCLFIIPGGAELAKTKMIYEFLKAQGHSDDEMSILFRLPSSSGKEFNDFVKTNNLNSPITDKTKFVFVSLKLPKPVIDSKKKFHSVISLGKSNVHYTIREFVRNRQDLIYYCEKGNQKEFNFGYL